MFDDGALDEHGYAATEAEALAAGTAAIKRFAVSRRITVRFWHGLASELLKDINKAKRTERLAARPSSAKDSKAVEYLYAYQGCSGDLSDFCPCYKMSETDGWNYHIHKFAIIRKTAKRIYYDRQPLVYLFEQPLITRDGTGFVDRQKIEQDGEIYTTKRWEPDWQLYLLPPPMPDWRRRDDDTPNLQQLKAEMADAHPDRGGSNAAFIAARDRYVRARASCGRAR